MAQLVSRVKCENVGPQTFRAKNGKPERTFIVATLLGEVTEWGRKCMRAFDVFVPDGTTLRQGLVYDMVEDVVLDDGRRSLKCVEFRPVVQPAAAPAAAR